MGMVVLEHESMDSGIVCIRKCVGGEDKRWMLGK